MNAFEELDYLKRVCNELQLCAVCDYFEPNELDSFRGNCSSTSDYTEATDEGCSGWERRPEPLKLCRTCIHYHKQRVTVNENVGLCHNGHGFILRNQKACKEWEKDE